MPQGGENRPEARVGDRVRRGALEAAGCTESQKKMRIVMEEHFKEHAFVKLYAPGNVRTWLGLVVRDHDYDSQLF